MKKKSKLIFFRTVEKQCSMLSVKQIYGDHWTLLSIALENHYINTSTVFVKIYGSPTLKIDPKSRKIAH